MPNKKYTECTWCNVGWAWKSEKIYYPVCWNCGAAWPGDEQANQARLVEKAGNQQRSWSGYSSDTGSEGWGANVARPRRLVSPGTPVKPVNYALEALHQLGPSLNADQQEILKKKGITLRSVPEPPSGLDSLRLSATDLKSLEAAALKLSDAERRAFDKITKAYMDDGAMELEEAEEPETASKACKALRICQANLQKALKRQATLQQQAEEQKAAYEKLVADLAKQTEKVKQCEQLQEEALTKAKDFLVQEQDEDADAELRVQCQAVGIEEAQIEALILKQKASRACQIVQGRLEPQFGRGEPGVPFELRSTYGPTRLVGQARVSPLDKPASEAEPKEAAE